MALATDKTKVSSYMDDELVRQIRVLAAMEGKSVSSYLESLAKREVEQAKKKGVRFEFDMGWQINVIALSTINLPTSPLLPLGMQEEAA